MLFAALNLLTASLLALGVFRGLPVRSVGIDACAGLLICGFLGSAVGLALQVAWGVRFARLTAQVSLGLASCAIVLLLVSMSFLAGVNGAVGTGGVVLAALIIALIVPYLVALPLLQLWWLRRA